MDVHKHYISEISEVMHISPKRKCLNASSKISFQSRREQADEAIELEN